MVATPAQYTPTIQDKPQNQIASENAIKMQREIAAALMAQKTKANPFYTWANGLDDMTAKIMGGMEARNADEKEAARNTFHAGNNQQFQGGQPAAPGGAATLTPFTDTPSSTVLTGPRSSGDQLSEFVRQREGFRETPYPDGKQTSIGYGTRAQGPNDRVDRVEGERRLQTELAPAAAFVNRNFPNAPDKVKSALTDLTYNTGTKWATAGLGQAVRAGDYQTAGQLFQQYNHANGQVLPGLTARRQAMAGAFAGDQPQGSGMLAATPPTAPAMMAQAAPGRQPPGNMQSDFADYLYRRGGPGNSPPPTPEESLKFRMGTQPNYEVDPYGGISRTAPGEVPRFMGTQPNAPGVIEKSPAGWGALRTYKKPDGSIGQEVIIPTVPDIPGAGGTAPKAPTVAPKPAATPAPEPPKTAPTPPKTAPGGGNTPPNAPNIPPNVATAPKPGMLAAEPPGGIPQGTKAGSKLAMADVIPAEELYNTVKGRPSKLAQAAKDENLKAPEYNLDKPATTEEQAAKEAVDKAIANPPTPLSMPNTLGKGLRKAQSDPDPLERLGALNNIIPEGKVQEKAFEDKIKAQDKGFAELQKSIRDTERQAGKLAPELKLARRLIESIDFHGGPANKTVEWARGLREEFRDLVKDFKTDYTNKKQPIPGWVTSLDKWLDDPAHRSATANQVYTKILSGSILQSLRGMLGPNSGQFRALEFTMLKEAFGNPNLTKDANRVVMGMIDKINDRSMLIGKMTTRFLKQNPNGLDASFEEALADFEREHPTFQADEYDKLLRIVTGAETPAESNVEKLRRMMREKNGR